MATMSQSQVDAHNLRIRPKFQSEAAAEQFTGKEEELAQLCIAEIRRRRWYFTRNTPGRYSTGTPGTPDLIISADKGITFYCELKKKGNKLSEAQNVTRHVLLALNHRHAVIFSFQQFLDFIDGKNETVPMKKDGLCSTQP
jgi:hypothetical protein